MDTSFSSLKEHDISIVICGAAGQGIQTVEHFLTRVLKSAGYNVFATREYMSRVRGGTNSTEIRVSSHRVRAYLDRIDLFIPLHKSAISRQQYRFSNETIFIGEPDILTLVLNSTQYKAISIPFTHLAKEIGGIIYASIISAGMLLGLFEVEISLTEEYLTTNFAAKGELKLSNNLRASKKGYELAADLQKSGKLHFHVQRNPKVSEELFIDGAEAVSIGAIAGGCNWVSGYPMSPATGVLRFLANQSVAFDIIVEQCEDEISVINSAIGAWYAGGRGLVSTSGGGFALMSEALSFIGQGELPAVIHIAQRPGPATGLPTRTIQSDLFLTLYAGHGFFPRIIFAPGTIKDTFYLTQNAFNLAAKFQVPVFILTDQYLINSYYNMPFLDTTNLSIEEYLTETQEDYQRYQFTDSGISPRGIPGSGKGFVTLDSHTHDESGHVSEDLHYIRPKMVEKRLKKLELIKREIIPPELIGAPDYEILLIGWGSTYYSIREAMEKVNNDRIAFLHYKQVYPLHPDTLKYLSRAKTSVVIEGNVTAQFGCLIQQETGIKPTHQFLKYNGLQFSVEEIIEEVKRYE
ncbi:MAG: 2-oxoacid:acceptor oxidoreductase subunit alpha [Candidatus Helarchaeota archaeon]